MPFQTLLLRMQPKINVIICLNFIVLLLLLTTSFKHTAISFSFGLSFFPVADHLNTFMTKQDTFCMTREYLKCSL